MFKVEIKGFTEAMRNSDGQNVTVGLRRGLKKVGDSTKVVASKKIRDEYNIKKSDVDSKFTVTVGGNVVVITAVSRPINLTYFGAKQFGSRRGKRVTYRRVKDTIKASTRGKAGAFGGVVVPITGRKTTLLPSAFLAKVKAGKKGSFSIGVFKRASYKAKTQYQDLRNRRKTSRPYVKRNRALVPKQREAIINTAFVSVSTLFGGKKVVPAIKRYIATDALKTIVHEISWSIRGKQ